MESQRPCVRDQLPARGRTLPVRVCFAMGPQLASGLGRNRATFSALARLTAAEAREKLTFSVGSLASSLPAYEFGSCASCNLVVLTRPTQQ